ncbi:MAG TPA: hypothetical protein DEB40_01080 [Elusimicrobia bacterium]|nr:hypothetical protein [Elusimicrobiota bacterium]HBT60323.1 hypothetical protein [Elusimicrobiota bacterium]
MGKRGLIASCLLSLSWRPCHAILPTSGLRVSISTASVTGLDCRMRDFKMEYAKTMGQSYRQMSAMTFTRNPDPRVFLMGLGGMIVMVPLAVLSVPADLVAAPFRQECAFEFKVGGALVGWAGQPAGQGELSAVGRSLVWPGVEGVSEPVYRMSRSTTNTDADGKFEIALSVWIGRTRTLELRWAVNSLPSGAMSLRKNGGVFILEEPEPAFGSGVETIEPIIIKPGK